MGGGDSSTNYGYQPDYAAQSRLVALWHHTGEEGSPLYYNSPVTNTRYHPDAPADGSGALKDQLKHDDIDKVHQRVMTQSAAAAMDAANAWTNLGGVLKAMRDAYAAQTDALQGGTGDFGQWDSNASSAFFAKGPGAAMASMDNWQKAAADNASALAALSGIIGQYRSEMTSLYAQYRAALSQAEAVWNKFWSDYHDSKMHTGAELVNQKDWNREHFVDLMKQVRDGAVPFNVQYPSAENNVFFAGLGSTNWSLLAFQLEARMARAYDGAISNLYSARGQVYAGPTDAVTVDSDTLGKVLRNYYTKALGANVPGLTPPALLPPPKVGTAPDPGPAPSPAPDPGTAPVATVPDPGTAPGGVPDPGGVPGAVPVGVPDPGLPVLPVVPVVAAPAPVTAPNPGTLPGGLPSGAPGTGLPGGLPPATLPPNLPGGMPGRGLPPNGLITRPGRPVNAAAGDPGASGPPGAPGLGGRGTPGKPTVRRGVLNNQRAGANATAGDDPPGVGAPGQPAAPPLLPPGGTPGTRRTAATPTGLSGPLGDHLGAGAAPPSAPPVLGAPRRPDLSAFVRAGTPVPPPGAVRATAGPGGAGPSVLRAPHTATPASSLPPGLPPGLTRRVDVNGRVSYEPPLTPADWLRLPGVGALEPTVPVIDGSARLARIGFAAPDDPIAPPTVRGAAPAVLGRPRSAAQSRRRTRRRDPEMAARHLATAWEPESTVAPDEQAFEVASPGGPVLANELRPEPEARAANG